MRKAIKIFGTGAAVLFVLMALVPATVSAVQEPKFKIVEGKLWTTSEFLAMMIDHLIKKGAVITGVEWEDKEADIWVVTYLIAVPDGDGQQG